MKLILEESAITAYVMLNIEQNLDDASFGSDFRKCLPLNLYLIYFGMTMF